MCSSYRKLRFISYLKDGAEAVSDEWIASRRRNSRDRMEQPFDVDAMIGTASEEGAFEIDPSMNRGFMKVFCECGRIVDMEINFTLRRRLLNKPLECSVCRARRLEREFSCLDEHYNVVEGNLTL